MWRLYTGGREVVGGEGVKGQGCYRDWWEKGCE